METSRCKHPLGNTKIWKSSFGKIRIYSHHVFGTTGVLMKIEEDLCFTNVYRLLIFVRASLFRLHDRSVFQAFVFSDTTFLVTGGKCKNSTAPVVDLPQQTNMENISHNWKTFGKHCLVRTCEIREFEGRVCESDTQEIINRTILAGSERFRGCL